MNVDTRETLKGILYVNIATLAWATNIILGRYVRDQIGPLTLTAARYVVAGAVFFLLLQRLPREERRLGDDFRPLLGMAATGIVLFAPLIYFGLRFTTAVNGTLINGMGPLLTAFFAAWLIGEPYSRRQLWGALGAMVGVVILITGGSLRRLAEVGINPGDVLVLAAAAVWGLYSVAGRRATRQRTSLSATALSIYLGLPILLVAALWEQRSIPVVFSGRLLLIILYLGLVPAATGYFLWNVGVKKLGTGGAMVFYNTLPLYGAILGFLLLGETIALPHVVGGAFIIGGGVFSAVSRRERGKA